MGKGFEDLEVYQVARAFRSRVFNLVRQLPADEKYVLCSQMRRAALSITNNIAEGHGSRSYRHNISYLYRSRSRLFELQDDISACEEQGYFEKKHLHDLREHSERVARLINGYIAYLRKRLTAEKESD